MERQKEKKEKVSFWVDGTEYKTYIPEGHGRRPMPRPPEPGVVGAFIPGTVLKVYVREGQRVREGDRLVTLEAMKMKNRVLAPVTGEVTEVLVQEGDRVGKDQPLLRLRPDEPDEEEEL